MYHIVRGLSRNLALSKMARGGNHVKFTIKTCVPIHRIMSTAIRSSSTIINEESLIKKFMKKVGWMDQSRTVLKLAGYFLYGSVADKVSYNEWFEKCELPDTFSSWFIVTELHVWMLMVRCMAEDLIVSNTEKKSSKSTEKTYAKGSGVFIRNCVIEALWADVANRIKLLEGANTATARNQVSELSEQFQAAIIGYDEGLEDDRALAGAVWRRFYAMSPTVTAMQVESIVSFIRHQMFMLDKISKDELWSQPTISWLSISDHLAT